MDVDDKTAREFRELYERVYGKPIELGEAREMARRVLRLFGLLVRPPPR